MLGVSSRLDVHLLFGGEAMSSSAGLSGTRDEILIHVALENIVIPQLPSLSSGCRGDKEINKATILVSQTLRNQPPLHHVETLHY